MLAQLGHTVHVLTHAMPGVPRDEVIRGIQVHRWIKSSKRGPLFALTFVGSVLRGLRRLQREAGFDLIHTHQAYWEGVAAGFWRRGSRGRTPTLVQPASSGYYGEAEELSRSRAAPLLRRIVVENDAFVAISDDIAREWLALGVPVGKITKIASGVDTERYHPAAKGEGRDARGRLNVIFTGRLHPQKNLKILIEAWPAVAAATDAQLILVGHGPERDELETLARMRGVADRVTFAGAMAEPADWLRRGDVFVLPSLAEGMSNSLLEAMATGLACLASDIGGNQDLLGPGGTGVLVRGKTAEDWSGALIGLLGDRERRTELGERALARIRAEYALDGVVSRYVALYRALIPVENRAAKGPA